MNNFKGNISTIMGRESYFWHKLHSLTGIIPVGYYLVQHLALNTFSLAGPDKFNGVIAFFESMPLHFLLALKFFAIWLPLIFHAVYGLFITSRAQLNISEKALKYRENWMYTFQRATGFIAFAFLVYHMYSTSIYAQLHGSEYIEYAAWAEKLSSNGYYLLGVYALGVLACTYHFSYGIWNFCIRWGITISEKAQLSMQKFSMACFVALTLMGWAALGGFLIHKTDASEQNAEVRLKTQQPLLKTNMDAVAHSGN
jgi:succinate dehydrogenase / fumarate reductase cytochrome b subunit